MTGRSNKDVAYVAVAVLSVLFVAAQCEDATSPNFAESTFTRNSPGLDRIKLLSSGEKQKQNSPAVQLNDHKKSNEKMGEEQKKKLHTDEESGSLTSIHDDNRMAIDGSQKKVSSHEAELRSNSSSSAVGSTGLHSSTNPLSVDHHQREGETPGTEDLVNRNSNLTSEIAHEHVERYQLHQSSEEQDSLEDASFKAPTSGRVSSHGKVSDSIVVNSDTLPVRQGSNSRIPGKNNVQNNGILTFRKPLPILRQEAAQTDASKIGHDIHD